MFNCISKITTFLNWAVERCVVQTFTKLCILQITCEWVPSSTFFSLVCSLVSNSFQVYGDLFGCFDFFAAIKMDIQLLYYSEDCWTGTKVNYYFIMVGIWSGGLTAPVQVYQCMALSQAPNASSCNYSVANSCTEFFSGKRGADYKCVSLCCTCLTDLFPLESYQSI